MLDTISCPKCQRKLRLPESCRGQEVQCPSCQGIFHVPSSGTTTPAALPVVLPARSRRGREDDYGLDKREAARRARYADRRPPPAKSSGLRWLLLAIPAMFMCCCGLSFWQPWNRGPQPQPWVVRDLDPEEKRQQQEDVRDAFQNPKPFVEVGGKFDEEEFKTLFRQMGEAIAAQDAQRITAFWDAERMTDEILAQQRQPERLAGKRKDIEKLMRLGLGQAMAQKANLLAWDQSEIRLVKKLGDDEVVVIARHHTRDGIGKFRWWLIRRPGGWRVYDREDLDLAARFSVLLGSGLAPLVGGDLVIGQTISQLGLATSALREGDPVAADRHLQAVPVGQLPSQIEALRALVTGMVRVAQNQPGPALDALNQAHQLNPDIPCIDLFKGIAHNRLANGDKALKHLQTYQALLGDDANVCRELGIALSRLGRAEEALAAYRKSLDYNPKEANSLLGMVQSLGPNDSRADLGARFVKLTDHHQNFDLIAADCRQARDHQALEPIALAMRMLDPDYIPAHYHLALALAWARKPVEAMKSWKDTLAREKDEGRRKDYAAEFFPAVAQAGAGAEAYGQAPDPVEAFRLLATELQKSYRTDELRRLTAAHAKKHPGDPLLALYQAEIYHQEGKYAQADRAFAAAVAGKPEPAVLDPFRMSRVTARYHTGHLLDAYADIGPRDQTFTQLANLCLQNQSLGQLQLLLNAHAKQQPDDPLTSRYQYRLMLRREETEAGVALVRKLLAAADESQHKQIVEEFLFDMVDLGKPLEGYRAAPDGVQAFKILAADLQQMARVDELRQLMQTHRAKHAGDPWLAYYTGQLHLDEMAWLPAVQAFEEAWEKGPNFRQQIGYQYAFALFKAGKALEAYEKIEPRKDRFNQLANLLAQDRQGAAIQALVNAHRPHAGDDPDLLFQEGRAKFFLNQPTAAIPLLQKAYRKQDAKDYRRRTYLTTLVLEMAELGRGLEGYLAAPDKEIAFETLAPWLVNKKKAKELEALLTEHGKAYAKTPWHQYHTGELHLLRGDTEKAEEVFAAALVGMPSQNQWTFRGGLNRARIKAGKAVIAYQEAGGDRVAFENVGYLCIQLKDGDQLAALVAARRKAAPEAAELVVWDLEVRWLKQDYEGALQFLAQHRTGLFAQPQHQYKHDNYLVRGLVKLKRTDEAVREAKTIADRTAGNRLLLVYAHAAKGDVAQTIAAAGGGQRFLIEDCYRDPDLGPILRSAAFQEFRQRFPEPKLPIGLGGLDLPDDG